MGRSAICLLYCSDKKKKRKKRVIYGDNRKYPCQPRHPCPKRVVSQFEIATLLVVAKHQQSQAVLLIAVARHFRCGASSPRHW